MPNFNQEPSFDIVDDELAFPEWPDDGEEPIEESLWAGQLANALQVRRKVAKKNSQKAWKQSFAGKASAKAWKKSPAGKTALRRELDARIDKGPDNYLIGFSSQSTAKAAALYI